MIHMAYLELVLKLSLENTQPSLILIAFVKMIDCQGRHLQKEKVLLSETVPAEAIMSLNRTWNCYLPGNTSFKNWLVFKTGEIFISTCC